jgi:hypothetical protein
VELLEVLEHRGQIKSLALLSPRPFFSKKSSISLCGGLLKQLTMNAVETVTKNCAFILKGNHLEILYHQIKSVSSAPSVVQKSKT